MPRRTRQARDKRKNNLQIGTQKAEEQPDEDYGRIQCQANNHIQHLIHKDHFPLQLIKKQKKEENIEIKNCSSLGVVRKSQISSLISNVIVDKLFTNKY